MKAQGCVEDPTRIPHHVPSVVPLLDGCGDIYEAAPFFDLATSLQRARSRSMRPKTMS